MGQAAASGPLACGGDGFLTGARASRDYQPDIHTYTHIHTKERILILIIRLLPLL